MIQYTYGHPEREFNAARHTATASLAQVLRQEKGREGVTELALREAWARRMDADPDLLTDGWYCPPPRGMAVLFGERVHFDSLRNPVFWSSERVMDWERDVLYAYCSPAHRPTGTIGDTSATLYFGADTAVRDHIRRCHDATVQVFEALERADTAGDLFRLSQEIFRKEGLKSLVISRTDAMPVNLGHTFPVTEGLSDRERLTGEDCRRISSARLFLNGTADWTFTEGLQFTVEPQLVSVSDAALPKVSQHYLVESRADGFTVCNDIDGLLEEYGLI